MVQTSKNSSGAEGGLFMLGLFLAIGLALGGYFVSQTLYKAKVAMNTAEVKGLAERRVTADQANWEIGYRLSAKQKSDVPALYKKAEQQQAKIIALLKQSGFSDNEIEAGVLNYQSYDYRNEAGAVVDQEHTLYGTVKVDTPRIDNIKQARTEVNQLIGEGYTIDNMHPRYRFTKLNDIKPDMLREATTNARLAATEFAENAGVKVGSIQSARQGNFDIRDAGEEFGDTAKIEKDVRVVTTITFYLTD